MQVWESCVKRKQGRIGRVLGFVLHLLELQSVDLVVIVVLLVFIKMLHEFLTYYTYNDYAFCLRKLIMCSQNKKHLMIDDFMAEYYRMGASSSEAIDDVTSDVTRKP